MLRSQYISFPLPRPYPLPDIETPEQLLRQFDEVFDDDLITLITDSNVDEDWGVIGWRGIAFSNGALWMYQGIQSCNDNDDSNPSETISAAFERELERGSYNDVSDCPPEKVVSSPGEIGAINHETEAGYKKWKELINLRNRDLHPSLREYIVPILNWDTKSHKVRVDGVRGGDSDDAVIGFGMRIGEGKYRLSLWDANKKQIEPADLTLYGKPFFVVAQILIVMSLWMEKERINIM